MKVQFRFLGMLGVMLLTLGFGACGSSSDSGGGNGGSTGTGGGGNTSADSACTHYCSCSFASSIPNCQSTCVDGINMATNPTSCAQCTGSSSCDQLSSNACKTPCAF
jgi:hypothetical protein